MSIKFKWMSNMNICSVLGEKDNICQNINCQESIKTLQVANWAESKARQG